MKKTMNQWKMILLSILFLGVTACNSDKDDPTPSSSTNKNVLIGTFLPNASGSISAGYIQLIDGISPNTYNNKSAYPTVAPNIVIGKKVYALPGWVGSENVMKVYAYNDGNLSLQNTVQLPTQSGANSVAVSNGKLYVSYSFIGKIGVFNENSLQHIKDIDLSSYAVGDGNPDPCQMIVRDNVLFVALNQIVGANHTSSPTRAKVDVLLVDTKTDAIKKMITNSSAGMSMPTVPDDAGNNSIFMDKNKDIYINCISGFGFLGQKAGFLRIKNGEEDFDPSYVFDITSTPIQGESNNASYVLKAKYAPNGKVYATVNISAYYSQPEPNWLEDKTIFPVEIDLSAKTIKKLGNVSSTNFATAVGLYKDKVVFGLKNNDSNGFFIYDPSTQKMSEKAVINVTGYPLSFDTF